MTREEAIAILTETQVVYFAPKGKEKAQEALDMAIEALSQPIVCTDFRIAPDHIYCAPEMAEKVVEALHDNTNVQNMHKGKWIKKQVFNPELDKYVPFIECSVCGYEPYYGGSESKFNYCANCGADMRGGDTE